MRLDEEQPDVEAASTVGEHRGPVRVESAGDIMRDQITQYIESLARADPETIARLLRTWLAETKRSGAESLENQNLAGS